MAGREYCVVLMDEHGNTITEVTLLVRRSRLRGVYRIKGAASALIIPAQEVKDNV